MLLSVLQHRGRRQRSRRQLSLDSARRPCGHGGWRPGAGRPRRNGACSHGKRERFTAREPVHVTLRIVDGVPSLRQHAPFQIVLAAITSARVDAERAPSCPAAAIRIVEYTVQSNHVHLVVEADGPAALARGMKSLEVRLARRLNRCFDRQGKLFAERYHSTIVRSPRQAHHALRYILLNARRHAAERGARLAPGWIDPWSSAPWFSGWRDPSRIDRRAPWLRDLDGTQRPTSTPRTWLLIVGWRKHGLLDPDEAPGPSAPLVRGARR
jgi:REP element-mobilizing transposase RayT